MRVLVAENDPVTLRLLEATLRGWGYDVLSVATGGQVREAVENGQALLCIIDWTLPDGSGLELCRRLRRTHEGSFTYIILLSARDGRKDIIEGLKAGADGYLTKPFDRQELEVRLRAGERVLDLQRDLLETQDRLQHMAKRDGLTGLLNHQAIIEELAGEFERHLRHGEPLGVVMGDLDRFKTVNDTWGHLAGDTVLKEVAQRMVHAVRPYDKVGRYGGEEFVIILPGCDGVGAAHSAERVRTIVADQPVIAGTEPVSVSISLGTAASDDLPAADADGLVRAADRALYEAKAAGRNCVRQSAPDPGA
jgi:two-component system cell cycle response regulator